MNNPIQKKLLRDSAYSAVEYFTLRFSAAEVGNPKRVAEELVAHVLDCRPLEVYLRTESLAEEKLQTLEKLATRIEAGEPLQYVVGHVDFFGLKIKCDPRALIPRPETELLVEEVLASKPWKTLVDVGTGSGCIVLALAKNRPEANFTAVDVSTDALALARENAQQNGLGEFVEATSPSLAPKEKIQWMKNHLLTGFAPASFDVVVANLPYISSKDWKVLDRPVRDHEPRSALDSGPSGMELIEKLAHQASTVLVPGGTLFLEFGFDQGDAVFQCLEKQGYSDIRIKPDLAGLDRMAIAVTQ